MSPRYRQGSEVLGGIGIGDFVPWLGLVGKVAGGLLGGGGDSGAAQAQQQQAAQQQQQMQMMMMQMQQQQQQREAAAKAEAAAAQTKMIMYAALGLVGLGGAYMIFKKK